MYSYAIWVDEVALVLYFERGTVAPLLPTGIEEGGFVNAPSSSFLISPTIVSGSCHILLTTAVACGANISIYDCAGRKVIDLSKENLDVGNHTIEIPIPELSKGIYFLSVDSGSAKHVKKFIVIR